MKSIDETIITDAGLPKSWTCPHFYPSQTDVHQYGDNNTCIHNVGTLNLGG